jgi:uncharacterized protein (TIGR02996 family)
MMPDTSRRDVAEAELAQAVEAGATAGCVGALARAWAAWPAVALERVTVALAEALPAASLDGVTVEEVEARWHELAAGADPDQLPTLLATPWLASPKAALARLEKLAAFPRDPRIVDHLLDLDTGERFFSKAGLRFWASAWRLMLEWGSVEAARRLPTVAPDASDPPWAHARSTATFAPLRQAFAGRLPVDLPLTQVMQRAVAEIELRVELAQRDVRALIDRVLAAPESDSARQVLADALVERGDPRGEFALLQFAHERGELTFGRRERMARLLAGAGRRWFFGLLGQVSAHAVFRRGLVAEVQLATRSPDPAARGWALVEALSAAGLALPLAQLLEGGALPSLRRLFDLGPETFVHLVRGAKDRRFELVELRGPLPAAVPAAVCGLETLRVRANAEDAVRWFLATGLKPTALEADALTGNLARLGALLEPLGATSVRRLRLTQGAPAWPHPWRGAWTASFTRSGAAFDALELVLHADTVEHLEPLLHGLSPTVRVQVRTSARRTLAERQRLATHFEALGVRDVELRGVMLVAARPVIFDVR